MRKALAVFSFAFLLTLALVACSGSMNMQPTTNSTMTNVSLSMGDAPPMNVTILRFEVQVTAATLQPAMSGQQSVSLLKRPTKVELEHLQTEPAFLANLSVPAGTYNSLMVTFASPQMTILNQTGGTLTVGSQTCAAGQVCNLTPPLNQMTVTVQAPTAPFPITLAANSPLALLLHFDINNSVQNDLSVTPAINLTPVPPMPGGEFEHFHIVGSVTAINSPNFTLQTNVGGQTFTIATDSNTMFQFEDSCKADDFSCIAVGQVLKVKVKLMADGTLLATHVQLFEEQGFANFQGIVTSANAAQNQFQIVLTDMEGDAHQFGSMGFGLVVTIQPTASATFSVDSDAITVPSGLSFASVQDIFVGQVVRFHILVPPTAVSMGQITVSADSISLEPSEITGTVAGVNASATPPNFTLGGLPSLFTKAMVTQLEIEPVMGTEFDNVTGLSGLMPNDFVSVGGLLFNSASGPVVIAERVVKRQPEAH
jgi:Domain of unknown function (DUF5666)/Domain of unknown function (DUF4382)